MNKFIGVGNLCKDIELRSTPNGTYVIQNSIAIRNNFKNKDGEYDSEFINIVVWRNQAEFLNKYASKGSKILVEGRLTNRSYEKQDGTKGYISEVIAENVELLSPAKKEVKEETELPEDVPQNYKTEYQETEQISLSDEDLPF